MAVSIPNQSRGYELSFAYLDTCDVSAVAVDTLGRVLFVNRRFEDAAASERGAFAGRSVVSLGDGMEWLWRHPSVSRALEDGVAATIDGLAEHVQIPVNGGFARWAVLVPVLRDEQRAVVIQFGFDQPEDSLGLDSSADLQETILKVSQATHECDTVPDLCEVIHDALSDLVDTTNLYVALYDAQTGLYTLPYDVDTVDQQEFC